MSFQYFFFAYYVNNWDLTKAWTCHLLVTEIYAEIEHIYRDGHDFENQIMIWKIQS